MVGASLAAASFAAAWGGRTYCVTNSLVNGVTGGLSSHLCQTCCMESVFYGRLSIRQTNIFSVEELAGTFLGKPN
jgi:hypothetical protein